MTAPDAGLGERLEAVLAAAIYADAEGVDPEERESVIADCVAALAPLVAEEVAAAEVRALREAAEEKGREAARHREQASAFSRDGFRSAAYYCGNDAARDDADANWLNARADRLAAPTDGPA